MVKNDSDKRDSYIEDVREALARKASSAAGSGKSDGPEKPATSCYAGQKPPKQGIWYAMDDLATAGKISALERPPLTNTDPVERGREPARSSFDFFCGTLLR